MERWRLSPRTRAPSSGQCSVRQRHLWQWRADGDITHQRPDIFRAIDARTHHSYSWRTQRQRRTPGHLRPNMISMQKQEQDYFTPATREAIHKAQYEAIRMNVEEVTPEHLFLGVLAQDGDGVVETFSLLRLDQEALRKQAAIIFPSYSDTGQGDARNIPLSKEAQTCLEWAISFATNLHVPNVQLEHVLLGSMRHQHLQPLLALFLINAGSILPSYVTERSGLAYTTTMDQLITSRIRRRSMVRSNDAVFSRILSSFERPTLTFSDIVGFHEVKRELREVIDFLRNPQLVRQDVRSYLYGLLLVGPPGNNRTLIGQAIAGEGAVPLLSLSIPALFEMANSASNNQTDIFGPVRSPHESGQPEKMMIAQSGRRMIHDLFEQGKKASPCVIYIDTLDALASPEMRNVGQQWQSQLRIEMDGCDNRPAMAVMATTSRHGLIDQSLLLPGCFDHTATLDGTVTMPFEAGLTICSACQQEVPARWKYCGFCGAALARACPHCGARYPDVKGISFCPDCGNQLREPEKDTLA